VDEPQRLRALISAMVKLSEDLPVLFHCIHAPGHAASPLAWSGCWMRPARRVFRPNLSEHAGFNETPVWS
jgi:hypothetical protein